MKLKSIHLFTSLHMRTSTFKKYFLITVFPPQQVFKSQKAFLLALHFYCMKNILSNRQRSE